MIIILWFSSVSLLLAGSVCILGNLWIMLKGYLYRQGESLIPLVGGILAAIGLVLVPLNGVSHYFWIPLLLDLGCVPLIAGTAIDFLVKKLARIR